MPILRPILWLFRVDTKGIDETLAEVDASHASSRSFRHCQIVSTTFYHHAAGSSMTS